MAGSEGNNEQQIAAAPSSDVSDEHVDFLIKSFQLFKMGKVAQREQSCELQHYYRIPLMALRTIDNIKAQQFFSRRFSA